MIFKTTQRPEYLKHRSTLVGHAAFSIMDAPHHHHDGMARVRSLGWRSRLPPPSPMLSKFLKVNTRWSRVSKVLQFCSPSRSDQRSVSLNSNGFWGQRTLSHNGRCFRCNCGCSVLAASSNVARPHRALVSRIGGHAAAPSYQAAR
jgi:hypothetical protein